MPEKKTIERARKAKRSGKAPSTQAGEFVREEMEHIREGKHGAKNPKQAIAIGLSKARRAGVKLPPPKKGTTSERTREKAKREVKKAAAGTPSRRTSPKRGETAKRRATSTPKRGSESAKRKRAPRTATSPRAASRQGRSTAPRRKRTGGGTTRRRGTKPSASSSE